MSSIKINPNVDDLSLATIDAAVHHVQTWATYEVTEDSDREVEWYESMTYTDNQDRHLVGLDAPDAESHTLIVSGGSVMALYVDGVAYESHEYDEYAEQSDDQPHLDADEFAALFEVDPSETYPAPEGPAMNYWYECEVIDNPREAAGKLAGLSLCVVDVDGKMGLALTGGGMDMTWDIVAAYVALGALPPYRYACDLPGMADRGKSEADKVLIAACLRTLQATAERATFAAQQLQQRAAQWADR